MEIELRAVAAQKVTGLGIQTGKSQSFSQASRLGSMRLFRWRTMPHNASPKNTFDPA
jgi:hypothetical protein